MPVSSVLADSGTVTFFQGWDFTGRHRLGNIKELPLAKLVASPQQQQFGLDKRETLPQYCLECDVRFACHGGCPKDRFIETPAGEPGLNYLRAGYKDFFHHIDPAMRFMAEQLRRGAAPADLMHVRAAEDAQRGRKEPCTCGSGRKWKHCHGSTAETREQGGWEQ